MSPRSEPTTLSAVSKTTPRRTQVALFFLSLIFSNEHSHDEARRVVLRVSIIVPRREATSRDLVTFVAPPSQQWLLGIRVMPASRHCVRRGVCAPLSASRESRTVRIRGIQLEDNASSAASCALHARTRVRPLGAASQAARAEGGGGGESRR